MKERKKRKEKKKKEKRKKERKKAGQQGRFFFACLCFITAGVPSHHLRCRIARLARLATLLPLVHPRLAALLPPLLVTPALLLSLPLGFFGLHIARELPRELVGLHVLVVAVVAAVLLQDRFHIIAKERLRLHLYFFSRGHLRLALRAPLLRALLRRLHWLPRLRLLVIEVELGLFFVAARAAPLAAAFAVGEQLPVVIGAGEGHLAAVQGGFLCCRSRTGRASA